MGSLQLSELAEAEAAGADIFICSASFEDRSVSIAEHIPDTGLSRVLVFRSRRLATVAGPQWRTIKHRFSERARIVPFDGESPLDFADAASKEFSRLDRGTPHRYLVDVTAFTRENLLIILSLLRDLCRVGDRITIAYAGAQAYSVTGGDWLSRGYGDVRSVLGYPGELRPSQGEQLIVLVGYEDSRAEKLIRTYEPALLALGHCGDGQDIDERFHPKNVELHKRLQLIRQQVDSFTFSCSDPFAARDDILARVRMYPAHNSVVAPMNTKLSTVGAALAAFEEPRIQLCYLPAREYNEAGYSTGSGQCYLYELPI